MTEFYVKPTDVKSCHGRLYLVGYDSVGLVPVRYPDMYNRPSYNRPPLDECGRFSGKRWSVLYVRSRFSGSFMVKNGRLCVLSVGFWAKNEKKT